VSPALRRGSVVLIALVGAQSAMQKRLCGKSPDVARNGACITQAVIRCVMMAAIWFSRSIRF
jgi:hypothetical protein